MNDKEILAFARQLGFLDDAINDLMLENAELKERIQELEEEVDNLECRAWERGEYNV